MEIVYFVALNVLGHLAFVGARMTTSLFALNLGASPATVGMLMALFAALPALLSVSTGRLIDRVGTRRPLLAALALLAAAAAMPFALPKLWVLFISSTLAGIAFMFIHIGMNSVFGAYGGPERRATNFAWLAIGFSLSGSLGPLVAGFAIQGLGHSIAFGILAVFPAAGVVMLWLRKKPLPRPERVPREASQHILDLFRVPKLRRTFIVSGILAMGWDLYAFLMPIYGAGLGLEAGTIGTIMATFAVATFVVRIVMSLLIRRVPQWLMISGAMMLAGAAYLLFPLIASAPVLMLLSFVLGLGLGCAQPVIMSLLYEAAPRGRQGEAVGVRTTMINTSQTFIPLTSGALTAALGMGPVFWLLGISLLGGGWYARRKVK